MGQTVQMGQGVQMGQINLLVPPPMRTNSRPNSRNESKSPSPHLAIISDFIGSRQRGPSPACFPKKKAMIDKEKTPINVSNCASDNMVKENMVKESVEKVHETAVVTTVQVEQAASSLSPALSSSSMIEGSRSALVMNSGSGLLQGNLPTLTKTSVDKDTTNYY